MKRNRMLALLLAGCMVLGNSNVLLHAKEEDDQFFMIEEDEELEIQEDVLAEQGDEEGDLYACDLIEDEEELYAAEIGDSEAPVFDTSTIQLELPEGQSTVTGGDTVKLSVKVTDVSDITLAKVFYKRPVSGVVEYQLRYNAATDRYETSIPISNGAQEGEWTIAYFFGRDIESNMESQYAASDGEFSAGAFTVAGTTSDTEAPVFDATTIQLELPEGQSTVTGGDTVKLSVKVTDVSDITLAKVFYKRPVSGVVEYGLRYNAATDRYETSIPISNGAQEGEWTIAYFFGRDIESNMESQYATSDGEFSAGSFTVSGKCIVTFNSRGGSEVETQYVLPGEKATEPERPAKGEGAWTTGGGGFAGWYTDETLEERFFFNTSINENITLFAKWYYGLSVCSYDISNQEYCTGGQFSVEYPGYFFMEKHDYSYGGSNFTALEGNITLSAKPDQGYLFKGWYKGETADASAQTYRPLDVEDPENLLSNEKEYVFYPDGYTIICPVFEVCTDHDFGTDQTIKATTTATGRVYHVCKNCGMEETIRVLPKLKPAPKAPAEKITVSKKPSIKKPAAAKGKITVKWKHFKHTSKKIKSIWKKIKKVQVQCATDKAFKNIVKTSLVGKSKTSAKIKGLKKKTTYYVRVRYYDGTGYSAWSKVKKVKTK